MGRRLSQLHHHPRFPLRQGGPGLPLHPRRVLHKHLQALHNVRVARGGPPDGHRGPHLYCCPATHRPVEVGHPGEIPRKVLHSENNDWDGLDNGGWCEEEEVEVPRRRPLRQVVGVEQHLDQLRALQQGRVRLATLQKGPQVQRVRVERSRAVVVHDEVKEKELTIGGRHRSLPIHACLSVPPCSPSTEYNHQI